MAQTLWMVRGGFVATLVLVAVRRSEVADSSAQGVDAGELDRQLPQLLGELGVASVVCRLCAAGWGLADSMHCDPSNVTRLLDRLDVTNGGNLVQRRRSDSDRRVVEVSLTDRGRETVSQHRRRRARDIPLFAGLAPDERARLEALLHEVASNLDTGHSEVEGY